MDNRIDFLILAAEDADQATMRPWAIEFFMNAANHATWEDVQSWATDEFSSKGHCGNPRCGLCGGGKPWKLGQ